MKYELKVGNLHCMNYDTYPSSIVGVEVLRIFSSNQLQRGSSWQIRDTVPTVSWWLYTSSNSPKWGKTKLVSL